MAKKLVVCCLLAFAAVSLKAQHDEGYTFINSLKGPDNSQANIYKKAALKAMQADSYTEGIDTNETVFEFSMDYDAEGRVKTARNCQPERPGCIGQLYTYDEKDRLDTYTTASDDNKKETYKITYDPKKDTWTAITFTGDTSKKVVWNPTANTLFVDSRTENGQSKTTYYFENNLLKKQVIAHRENYFAKGLWDTATYTYNYDKKGLLTDYKMADRSGVDGQAGTWETGTYAYDKKGKLLKAEIKRYNSEFNATKPEVTENYTYSYGKKGNLLTTGYTHKKQYTNGDQVNEDVQSSAQTFYYHTNGLVDKIMIENDPGAVIVTRYKYQ